MSRAPLALAFGLAAAASCQGLAPVEPCGEIPANGCPVGRGGTCDDLTCDALYDCAGGAWTRVQTCLQPDAGPALGGSDGGLDAGGDGACTPVHIDADGGATDCTPDLAFPDCPVQAAETCAESACLTGCSDFFLCTAPGWVDVAYCTDQGQLIVTQ